MESECLPCPGGQYCDTPGITEPSGNCSAGKLVRLLVSVHVKAWQSHNTSILEFQSVHRQLTGYCSQKLSLMVMTSKLLVDNQHIG